MGRISPAVYARILLAAGLAFFVLNKLRTWSSPWTIDDPLGPVSALEVIEAAILLSLCGRMSRGRTIMGRPVSIAIEELCILVLSLCIVATVAGPKLAFGLTAVAFAARLWRVPGARAAIYGFLILCAQLAASAGPLFAVHRRLGAIDAAVLRGLTHVGGFATSGAGNMVIAPSRTFAIEVASGCASSYVALGVMAGFFLIILWRRGSLAWRDLPWAAALVALVTLLNWGRLIPTIFSHDAYLFWHDGSGAQIVALLDGVATCGLALLAADRAVFPIYGSAVRANAPADSARNRPTR